jgi:hypothetical protein
MLPEPGGDLESEYGAQKKGLSANVPLDSVRERMGSPRNPDEPIRTEPVSADMAIAHKHMLRTSCTQFDLSTNSYRWRPVGKTTKEEIGDYGVGLQLYFEFLHKAGFMLFAMAILCTPLLVFCYYGDFAASLNAGFFAKMTIGNIGICGTSNEFCGNVTDYPYRPLLYGVSSELRDSTAAFGSLAATAIGLFGLFCFWFYYFQMPKITKRHDDNRVTPADFAVEVDYLPRRLRTPEEHGQYELLLRAHFEKIAGQEDSVADIAIAREYHGAIRTYLRINDLDIEIREMREQAKRTTSSKKEDILKRRLAALEKARASAEESVYNETIMEEHQRAVVKAFVTFSDQRFRDRVLNAYTWSRRHPVFRWLQSQPLRFKGSRIYVRNACEPDNVYQENLDVSRSESMFRRMFTLFASLGILLVAVILLAVIQSATRSDDAASSAACTDGDNACYAQSIARGAMTALTIVVVAFLNFILRTVMYLLADFERTHSLTDKVTSEMWKLFFAQFVNTAILVLIVNAKFVNAAGTTDSSIAGLGAGLYQDTSREWFVNIGAGLCLTILILVGTSILTTYMIEKTMQFFRHRWARSKFTQKAMNKQLERGDFMLSMRLAQATNIIVCVVMYFSGMPVLLWVGALGCLVTYWYDKYFLLRCSRVPPNYSNLTVTICLRLMPIAIVANCCFMIWVFGNQMVFPSDMLTDALYAEYNSRFNETSLILFISGYESSETYSTYMSSRVFDSLRKAAFGGLLILGVIALYLGVLLLYYVISKTLWALVELILMPFDRRRRRSLLAMERARIVLGLDRTDVGPKFSEAVIDMTQKRILSSYKLQDNPRFAPAYDAMNKLRHKQSKYDVRLKKASLAAAKGEEVEARNTNLSSLHVPSPPETQPQVPASPVKSVIQYPSL